MRAFILALAFSLGCLGSAVAEEPKDLAETAKAIQEGTLDMGKQYDMDKKKGRFHVIHSEIVGLECESCHVSDHFAKDFMVVNQQNELLKAQGEGKGGKADVLDRAVCLGCHKKGGVATAWYGTAAE